MIWFILALALILALILFFYYRRQRPSQAAELPPLPLPPAINWETSEELAPVPELAQQYQQEYLELLVQSSTCLYAYWEIERPETTPILRLSQLETPKTGAKPQLWQQEIVYQQTDLFWPELEPNQSYRLELGCLNEKGEFQSRLVSNTVRTPSNTVSSILDPSWPICTELNPEFPISSKNPNPSSAQRPSQ